eukprot:1756933-Alexandrium_andersonii.AAC.1
MSCDGDPRQHCKMRLHIGKGEGRRAAARRQVRLGRGGSRLGMMQPATDAQRRRASVGCKAARARP